MENNSFSALPIGQIKKGLINIFILIVDIIFTLILLFGFIKIICPPGSWICLVNGNSMYPTLHNKEIVYSNTDRNFERGDIVTVDLTIPKEDGSGKTYKKTLIKRIVGLPNECLIINKEGTITINGLALNEPYLTENVKSKTFLPNGKNSMLLGPNEFYVMGDNRGDSYDSRMLGKVTRENILYKQDTSPNQHFYTTSVILIITVCVLVCIFLVIEQIIKSLTVIIYQHRTH